MSESRRESALDALIEIANNKALLPTERIAAAETILRHDRSTELNRRLGGTYR